MSEKMNDTVRQSLLNDFKYDHFYISRGRYQQLIGHGLNKGKRQDNGGEVFEKYEFLNYDNNHEVW